MCFGGGGGASMHLGGGGGGFIGGDAQRWHYQTASAWAPGPLARLGAGGTSYVASTTNMGSVLSATNTTTFTDGYLTVTPMTQQSSTSFTTRTVVYDTSSLTDLTGSWEDINASAEYDPPSADASQVLDTFRCNAYY